MAETPARTRPTQAGRWLPIGLSVGVHALLLGGMITLAVRGASEEAKPQALVLARIEYIDPGELEADVPPADDEPLEEPSDPLAFSVDVSPVVTTPETEVTLPEMDPVVPGDVGEPMDFADVPLSAVKLRRAAEPIPETVADTPATPPSVPTPRSAPTSTRPSPRRGATPSPAPLRLLSRPDLERYYPQEARRRGLEGEALVEIRVSTKGTVIKAIVVRSSGHALLDRQALRVMYAYRFATGAGGRARVPVNFRLQ